MSTPVSRAGRPVHHRRRFRRELLSAFYARFRSARPAFGSSTTICSGTVLSRRRQLGRLRRFPNHVRVVFGADDRYLIADVARWFRQTVRLPLASTLSRTKRAPRTAATRCTLLTSAEGCNVLLRAAIPMRELSGSVSAVPGPDPALWKDKPGDQTLVVPAAGIEPAAFYSGGIPR
jgi:hypothetical protein